MPPLTGIALLAMLLTLSACTRVVTVRTPANDLPPGSATATGNEDGWWRIAIRMRWDPDQTPDWYLDALLADQVYAPALSDAGSANSMELSFAELSLITSRRRRTHRSLRCNESHVSSCSENSAGFP